MKCSHILLTPSSIRTDRILYVIILKYAHGIKSGQTLKLGLCVINIFFLMKFITLLTG